jgi:hypothetical protein
MASSSQRCQAARITQRAAVSIRRVLAAVNPRPLRWTEGQIERLLWAPQDRNDHFENNARRPSDREVKQRKDA